MAVNINVPSQVKTYANLAAFPATGALKTIYIAEDTNKTYRWTGSIYVEVSASAASGITIGSTAIASGVVGRVLFEGAGNVVQESSSLFWDNTNNRLGIGTSSPATLLNVSGNYAGTTDALVPQLLFENTNNTSSAYLAAIIRTRISTGYVGNFPELWIQSTRDASNVGITMIRTVSNHPLSFHTNDLERARIFANGNIGINTTTDAGFRLDVNGTARVQGNTSIINTGAYSTFSSGTLFLRNNSTGGNNYTFIGIEQADTTTKGYFSIGGTNASNTDLRNAFGVGTQTAHPLRLFTNDLARLSIFSTGNVGINTTTDAGFRLDVNGTARFVNDVNFNASARFGDGTARITGAQIGGQGANNAVNFYFNNGSTWVDDTNVSAFSIRYNQGIRIPNTSRYPLTLGSDTKAVASAQIEMVSTTQGFLPPRMTTTQINAIASPAEGLMVYNTTISHMCVYQAGSWVKLSHSPM